MGTYFWSSVCPFRPGLRFVEHVLQHNAYPRTEILTLTLNRCRRRGHDEAAECSVEALRRKMESWRLEKRREHKEKQTESKSENTTKGNWMHTEDAWWRGCGIEYIL